METTNVSQSTSSQSLDAFGGKTIGEQKTQFLRMLIEQLKHQDPMNPQDASQFTQHMMQMGQMEQLMNLNTSMTQMAAAQQGAMISQYSSIVGKDVLTSGNNFQISETNSGEMRFNLPSNPQAIEINVFDQYGNLVRSFDPSIMVSGDHTVQFDGKNSKGEDLPAGYYSYTVDALDHESEPIQTKTYSKGQISSIRLENGNPIFQMGENKINLSDIKEIY